MVINHIYIYIHTYVTSLYIEFHCEALSKPLHNVLSGLAGTIARESIAALGNATPTD